MLPPTLALLGLGAAEFAVIVVIYILLFGADKAPDLARSLGRAQAQMGAWKRELDKAYDDSWTASEGAGGAGASRADFEFELRREQEIRAQRAGAVEAARIRKAAEDLGIPTEGRSEADLRRAIRERVGPDSGAGDAAGGASE